MKRLQSLIGAGLTAPFVLLAVVEVAWPQVTSPAPPPAPEGVVGYGFLAFLLVIGLAVVVGIAAKVFDLKRKREDEGIALQSRLSDALLGDPSLAGLAVTPKVHVPFARRNRTVITLEGAVSSPARRDTALEIVMRTAAPFGDDYEIEDRLIVDPRITRHAA